MNELAQEEGYANLDAAKADKKGKKKRRKKPREEMTDKEREIADKKAGLKAVYDCLMFS